MCSLCDCDLIALENKSRYHVILLKFEDNTDIFFLSWLKIRVLSKLEKYQAAQDYTLNGSASFTTALWYQAFDEYIAGDEKAFDYLESQELMKISKQHPYPYP